MGNDHQANCQSQSECQHALHQKFLQGSRILWDRSSSANKIDPRFRAAYRQALFTTEAPSQRRGPQDCIVRNFIPLPRNWYTPAGRVRQTGRSWCGIDWR
jgi:hypothetical protein